MALAPLLAPDLAEDGKTGCPVELQQVRKELRGLLERVGAPEDAIFAVVLSCSEACGNAVRHPVRSSRAAFEVEAEANREEISIIVLDFGRWRAPKADG